MAKRRRGSRTGRPRSRHRPFEELVGRRPRRDPGCRSRPPSTRSRSSSRTSRPTSSGARTSIAPDETLYGLYEGVPRTEWGADWAAVPNRITLFRLPLEADFADPDDLADEVWVTVVHELAHHLGIDDDRLHRAGRRLITGSGGSTGATRPTHGEQEAGEPDQAEPRTRARIGRVSHRNRRTPGPGQVGIAVAAGPDVVEAEGRAGQPDEHHDLRRDRDAPSPCRSASRARRRRRGSR